METIADILRRRAAETPDRVAFLSLRADGGLDRTVTYRDLDLQASRAAARLMREGEAGDRVLLLMADPIDYLSVMFGCFYAGRTPVSGIPPYAPRSAGGLRHTARRHRLVAVLRDSGARAVVGPSSLVHQVVKSLPEGVPAALDALAVEEVLGDHGAKAEALRASDPQSIAMLQYTSGSTGSPGGVAVSHGNLISNLAAQVAAFRITPEDVGVSWLPLYHDLGLIGAALLPIYAGFRGILSPSAAFSERPGGWLETISEHGATMSWAPNFAFDLARRAMPPDARAALRLHQWRFAMNAAEPVSAQTIREFVGGFRAAGFRPQAMAPCYGLAEATLVVCAPPRPEEPIVLRADRASLNEGRFTPAGDKDAEAVELVACGAPVGDQRLRIVDPATTEACPDGVVGEIWVSGPDVAQGYFGNPKKTLDTFRAKSIGEPRDFLRTGDLGFWWMDRLFVTGRLKDLIIIRGANYYPHEIETSVREGLSEIRECCAFALARPEGEVLCVVCEPHRSGNGLAAQVISSVRRAIQADHGLETAVVALTTPGSILKTPSGKLQRRATRDALLGGGLPVVALDELAIARPGSPQSVRPRPTRVELERWLRDYFELETQPPAERDHFADLGITSIQLAAFAAQVELTFGRRLLVADLFELQRLSRVVDLLLQTSVMETS